jgi:NADP-dependent 3-hydroxy acid dehydrogenase YdfG
VVNVSSIGVHAMFPDYAVCAHATFPDYAVYGATKAAVTRLSRLLRTEFGPRDVRVTNIEPGLTETELKTHVASEELSGQLDGMFEAIGGLSSEEVADVIVYAASRPRHVDLRQIMVLPTRQA